MVSIDYIIVEQLFQAAIDVQQYEIAKVWQHYRNSNFVTNLWIERVTDPQAEVPPIS